MLADSMGASSAWRKTIQDDAHKSLTSLEIHCINITPSLEAIAWSLESVTYSNEPTATESARNQCQRVYMHADQKKAKTGKNLVKTCRWQSPQVEEWPISGLKPMDHGKYRADKV